MPVCADLIDNSCSNMTWRRQSKGVIPRLAQERKLLAERYTIDADEAERRDQLAVEGARQEALERDVADDEPAEQEREEHVAPARASQPDPDDAASNEEEPAADAELPIYRWLSGR